MRVRENAQRAIPSADDIRNESGEWKEMEYEVKYNIVPNKIPAEVLKALQSAEYDVISQGYIQSDPANGEGKIRVREAWNEREGVQRVIGDKKAVSDVARLEEERPESDLAVFKARWREAEGRSLHKIRFYLKLKDSKGVPRTVELDVFLGRHEGLILAEVEFDSENAATEFQAAKPFDWFGDDLSGVKEFKNSRLARAKDFPENAVRHDLRSLGIDSRAREICGLRVAAQAEAVFADTKFPGLRGAAE